MWSDVTLRYCRLGFAGNPRLDDRLSLWRRRRYPVTLMEWPERRIAERRKVEVWPVLVNIGNTDRCERAYYVRAIGPTPLTVEEVLREMQNIRETN